MLYELLYIIYYLLLTLKNQQKSTIWKPKNDKI